MNGDDQRQERLTLEVLSAIDEGPRLSQRHLANQLGVALGLTNSYVRRCVRKGYIKVNEAPANRYLYYLTPKGFREKSRLTARFLTSSLEFYRSAATSCEDLYKQCVHDGTGAVVLCGRSELAEIAYLKSLGSGVDVVGLFDEGAGSTKFFSHRVWRELDEVPEVGRVVTRIKGADSLLRKLRHHAPGLPVYVPEILGLKTNI